MRATKTVLVTGSTGLLGKALEETTPPGWSIVGVHQRDYRVEGRGARHLVADIRARGAVEKLFADHRFDAVIHAAGLASVDHVEKHPEEGRASNVQGTLHVAEACRAAGTFMVYVSTNAVFDGEGAPYAEDAPVRPLHHYGRIKLECERVTHEAAGEHAVVRPILMYGWNHSVNRPNPVTWVYEKLLRGEPVDLVDDIFENPLHSHQAAQALWRILELRPSGTFHLAGAERIDRHALGLKTAAAFGLDASLIRRVDSSFFPGIAPRPRDTTFVTKRMEGELGIRPLTIPEGLEAMRAEMGIGSHECRATNSSALGS